MDDSCFQVFARTAKEWNKARESCFRLGSDLAVVDSEIKRKIIGYHLTAISKVYLNDNIRAFLGIRKFGIWHWLDGSKISTSMWLSEHPWIFERGECGLLVKSWSLEWKLAHIPCWWYSGFICETDERKSFVTVNVIPSFFFPF